MNPEALAVIRDAVCAIGWISVTPAEFLTDPRTFEIEGTGFLVGRRSIVTCAHVVDALSAIQRKRGRKPFAVGTQFVFRRTADTDVATVFRPFNVLHRDERIDIAVLGMDGDEPVLPTPVSFVTPDRVPAVGEAVGLCGYAHGSVLLKRGKDLYRFGPVVQMGTVAALSPFDRAQAEAVILDLVTGPAASGSPVFRQDSGEVFGVLAAGQIKHGAALSIARVTYRDARGLNAGLVVNIEATRVTPRQSG